MQRPMFFSSLYVIIATVNLIIERQPQMSKAPTIMLVKNRALGDSIMGLSAVQYLKLLYPQSNIIYAVPQWIAPLYADSLTAADTIYPLKLKTVKDILKLFGDLRKFKIDHIHEMHQSGRGAKIFKWISQILGIRYTAHNHHYYTHNRHCPTKSFKVRLPLHNQPPC